MLRVFNERKADFTMHRYVSRDRRISRVIDAIRYYPRRYPIGRDPIALSDATIFTREMLTAHINIIAFFTTGLDLNGFYLNAYNFPHYDYKYVLHINVCFHNTSEQPLHLNICKLICRYYAKYKQLVLHV